MVSATGSHGVSVTPAEMLEANRWVTAKFGDGAEPALPEARLVVLANNDPVQHNGRNGRALNVAGRRFERGLFCHAVSKVVVRLPGPGKTFSAFVGVDTNEQTLGGRGSVGVSVSLAGKEAWRSELLREGVPGVPVSVDLAGATEFALEVADGGDGIACDQADWAEAKVVLADGGTVWLGDMAAEQPSGAHYGPEQPFSFAYGDRRSAELLPTWQVARAARPLDDQRTEHVLTYTDPTTGLVARCVAVAYRDFPTVEWTVHLKNTGAEDTPLLTDLQALDTELQRFPWPASDGAEFRLHHHAGSPCTARDYEPFVSGLAPKAALRFAPPGGRPSDSVLPYFNLELPTSEGVIVAVGWPGQWAATFSRDDAAGLRVRAGQELTHFVLRPGEEVRTPLIVLQFWKGDSVRAQNVWRRWMLAHNLPRPGGKLPPAQMAACSSHQFGEMIHADGESQKLFVDRYLEEGIKLDYWWMDAGWYVNETGWPNTGTWEVDTKRFRGGLRAITDHAHAKGVKSIVWFEPERVTPGTWLYDTHPEWLLGRDGEQKLLDLGNADARQWLTDHVDKLINEQGIDLYRNDFNIDPLGFWRGADAADRQGLTEIRYVEGFLAYWDELRRRHPNMLIDTCASGGRRNDLETLRRSVPLLRSDYIIEPVGQQLHTYGIASWIPFYGTGLNSTDPYVFRSQMCPHLIGCYDVRLRDLDYPQLRRLYQQWRQVADCYFGDYYPLTPYNAGNDVWMAWQFDPRAGRRPSAGLPPRRQRLRVRPPASARARPRCDLHRDRPRRQRAAADERSRADGEGPAGDAGEPTSGTADQLQADRMSRDARALRRIAAPRSGFRVRAGRIGMPPHVGESAFS